MPRFPFAAMILAVLIASPAMAAVIQIPMMGFAQNLSKADQEMLRGAVRDALTGKVAGQSVEWSDAATGMAGRVTVLRVYEQGVASCRSLEHVFTRGSGDRYILPFCLQPDGSWKIQF